jgi:hypothetical protein
MKIPQPWTVAMEATIFTGWIYHHLLPDAAQVKVAHPVMLRAIRTIAARETERSDLDRAHTPTHSGDAGASRNHS